MWDQGKSRITEQPDGRGNNSTQYYNKSDWVWLRLFVMGLKPKTFTAGDKNVAEAELNHSNCVL